MLAIPEKGMLSSAWEMVIFLPHVLLMYFLPPGYPFNDQIVNNWKIIGKIVDAFPASILYGVFLVLLGNCVRSRFRHAGRHQQ